MRFFFPLILFDSNHGFSWNLVGTSCHYYWNSNLICGSGKTFFSQNGRTCSEPTKWYLGFLFWPKEAGRETDHTSSSSAKVLEKWSYTYGAIPEGAAGLRLIRSFLLVEFLFTLNPLTPNDHYSGRTASLISKRCISYIYSTNIGTEYIKHGVYSPFFLFKMQFFHISKVFGSCIIHILYTGCAKIKKIIIPAPKG